MSSGVAGYSADSVRQGVSFDRFLFVVTVLNACDVFTTLMDHFLGEGTATGPVTLLWVLLYAVAAARLMLFDGIGWIAWLLRYRLVLLLIAAGVVASILWSIDPGLTMRRVVHFTGTTLLAFYFGYRLAYRELLFLLAGTLSILLLFSALSAVLLPDIGIQVYEGKEVWKGLFTDKNSLGFSSAIAVLLLLTLVLEGVSWTTRGALMLATVVALVALVGSHSATSMVAVMIGIVSMLLLLTIVKIGLAGLAVIVLSTMLAGIVALLLSGIDFSTIFSMLGRSSDLTGREEIWESVKALLAQKPWTGTGYGTIWFPTEESMWQQELLDLNWVAQHAHNGFYQMASQLGMVLAAVGVFFLLQMTVEVISIYLRTPAMRLALFAIGFQAAYIVSNNTEAYYLVDRHLFWMLQIAVPVALLRWAERFDSGNEGWFVGQRIDKGAIDPLLERRFRSSCV